MHGETGPDLRGRVIHWFTVRQDESHQKNFFTRDHGGIVLMWSYVNYNINGYSKREPNVMRIILPCKRVRKLDKNNTFFDLLCTLQFWLIAIVINNLSRASNVL